MIVQLSVRATVILLVKTRLNSPGEVEVSICKAIKVSVKSTEGVSVSFYRAYWESSPSASRRCGRVSNVAREDYSAADR